MEHSLFLRQYKYEIPAPATGLTHLPSTNELALFNQLPALSVFFDFENGDFVLEADSDFVLKSGNKHKNPWTSSPQKRFFINANMKPDIPEGPDDNLRNELLLFLKGSIYNGERQSNCSGLLSLNRSSQINNAQWMIYCNLVDNDLDVFEIKIRVPVITSLIGLADKN